MPTPRQPDYSDFEGYGSEGSDDSFDEEESPDMITATLQSVPGRSYTPTPQRTAGHGRSKYGPPPGAVVVANTGPAAGATPMYRKDREALFRWDSRGPEIIFREGFRNRNNLAPSSFQYYQNNHTESALVSFSRDPDPDAARPDWARAEGNHSYRYLAFPPGGYDFVASLGTASIANQDEVALWKGSLGKYVARVEVFNADDELVGRLDNPRASSGTKAALAEWDRREASREQYGAEESADLSSEQTYANVPNNQAAPHAQGYGYNSTGQTAVHSQGYENFPTNPMAAHVLGSQVQFSQRGPIQYSNSQPQAHGSRETRQQYEQYDASQNAQSATGARNGRRGRRR